MEKEIIKRTYFEECTTKLVRDCGLSIGQLCLTDGTLERCNSASKHLFNKYCKGQILYILSDDKICKGDMTLDGWGKVRICTGVDEYHVLFGDHNLSHKNVKKIIASSDRYDGMLTIPNDYIDNCYIDAHNDWMTLEIKCLVEFNEIELQREEWFQEAPYWCKYTLCKPNVDEYSNIVIKYEPKEIKKFNIDDLNVFKNNIGKNHLQFIYDRMIDVHGEKENIDYMLKFKEINDWLNKNLFYVVR